METIRNYLDNMFAALPRTERILELKSNIFSNMEEKYNELKQQGKSENEAIGIVISEFGNIDELVEELGITKDDQEVSSPLITRDEAEQYLNVKRKEGMQIGIGVFLCILAPTILILISTLLTERVIPNHLSEDAGDIVGLIAMFVLLTIAVGIFIYSGMSSEPYNYVEKGVRLPSDFAAELRQRYNRNNPIFYLKIIIGVCLTVFSPCFIFLGSVFGDLNEIYGTVAMLIIIAFSVYLFISAGVVRSSYEVLLKNNDFLKKHPLKKEDKVYGIVSSIVWPLAALIFLFCGFVYNLWHPAWVVFPITAILFGIFSAVYGIITDKNG